MAHPRLVLFRTLAAALLLGTLFGAAATSLAAPRAQDATPTAEPTSQGTPAATAVPTEPPAGVATLTGVDTSAFPALSAFMLVDDLSGNRIGALGRDAIDLSENGLPVRGLAVTEVDVGVQVVFVIDANDAFSARDANGVTRLQHVEQALNNFVSGAPALKPGLDVVTVLAPDKKIVERTDNPRLITQALSQYETNFGGSADPFPLLSSALDYALDVAPRPGMQRFIIYFSNGWNRFDIEAGVAGVASRALGAVPIYTVFVGPNGAGDTLGSQNLLRLAQATGGERLIFSGPDSLAPLFQRLSDRGRQYQLTYRSALAATGQHRLAAQVRLPSGGPALSNEIVFPLRVTAPMLRLGTVPASVVRVAASHDADPATADPTALEVPLTVDFPDGHPRGVRLAQLVVDGQVVVTQTAGSALQPMTWPLAAYTEAGDHQLQARLIDELGLAAESEAVTVNVSLQRPAAPPGPPLLPQVNDDNLPLLAVALAGLGLAAVIGLGAWWWAARRQRLAEARALEEATTLAARPVVRRVRKVGSAAAAAPASPPAAAARPASRVSLPPVGRPAFRWGSRPGLTLAKGACYFQVVEPGAGGAARPDIDLTTAHLTLGRDAALADTVFHDRSVSRLHARVVIQDGRVTIADQGSTSGTWVNYTPVQGEAGCELRHGDLVNLGRVQLRFLRRDAPPLSGNGARVMPAPPPSPAPLPGAHNAGASDKAGA